MAFAGEFSGSTFVLFAFNLGAWVWAVIVFHDLPFLLGTALLAYSLGLRHAVDADHIAAIDNVTRNLMQNGKRPIAVGLMFSLGHSTVVLIGAVAIAGTTLPLQHRWSALKNGWRPGRDFSFRFLLVCDSGVEPDRSAFDHTGRLRECAPASPTLKKTSTCFSAILDFFREFIVRCFA